MRPRLVPLLLVAFVTIAADVAVAEEPVPTTVPELRDEFSAATTTDDRAVARFCLAHPADPANGRLIALVDDGSAAAKAGFSPSDIIWSVDGKPIGDAEALPAGRHRFGIWSPTLAMRTIEAGDAERVGLRMIDGRTPDGEDFGRWTREPGPWDDDLVAAVFWRRDYPRSALAALARAKAAGYRGHLLQTLAAVTLAGCGRYDDALATGMPSLDRCAASERIAVCAALATAAFATGRYDLAYRILGKEPRSPSFSVPGTKVPRLDFGTPQARRDVGWLLAATATDHRDRSEAAAEQALGTRVAPQVLAALRAGQPIGVKPPSDHWDAMVLGPAFPDAEIELDVRAGLTTPTRERSGNELGMRIALVDPTQKATALSLRLEADGGVLFSPADDHVWRLHARKAPMDRATSRHVRLSVRGDRGAIFLDHACLWCGPMQLPTAGRKLCWEIFGCGMSVDCSGIAWRELHDGAGPDDLRRANLLLDLGRDAEADAVMDALVAKSPAMVDDVAFWHWNREHLDRSVALLDGLVRAKPGDDALALKAASLRLILGADPDAAIAQLAEHRSAMAGFSMPMLLLWAGQRSGRAADVIALLPADRRTREQRATAAQLLLESGRFAEAHAAIHAALADRTLGEAAVARLSIADAILAPMFGDEPPPRDEIMRNPFVPAVWPLLSAWLDGRVDDDAALARAGRCDPACFLFFAALRALAAGKHDVARATLAQSAQFGFPGVAGPARSLLAWYAQQTAESLAKLPRAGEARKAADDF